MASFAALDKSFASSFGKGYSAFEKATLFTAFIMDQDKAGTLASALSAQEERERIHHHSTPVPGIHTERQHDISSSFPSSQSLLSCEANAHEKNRAMVQVYEAIKSLPAATTADYRTALAEAPQIVAVEAHPLKFLRCCQGDPWNAAARLCHNLTLRRQVFGESHWLRPMNWASGMGALRPEDVELLRKGVFCINTPPADAPDQRQVMVVSFGRVHGQDMGMARKRVVFYLCLTTVNEYTQRHGLNVIVVIDGTGLKVSSENGQLLGAVNTSSAFTIHQVILANDPNETRVTLSHLFGLMVRRLCEKFWGKEGRLLSISEPTPEATLQALMAQGLHPSTVPTQLGGTWSYERDFKEWLAIRLVTEQTSEPHVGQASARVVSAFPPTATTTSMFSARSAQFTPSSSLNGNKIKDDDPSCALPTSWNLWKSEHNSRTIAGADYHLHQPQTATQVAAAIGHVRAESTGSAGTTSTSTEATGTTSRQLDEKDVRKRNCEYSKRHYYKKKNQMKDLQEQCETLRTNRDKLLAQHGHLCHLLQQAHEMVAKYRGS